jgi:hypothetical protein
MPVPRFLSRRPAPRRSASRTSERKPDLKFGRPVLERLEDRTLFDANSNLNALLGAAGTVNGFAARLASGPLSLDLPILSGGTAALGQILGLSPVFGGVSTALGQISVSKVLGATDRAAELQAELQAVLGGSVTVSGGDLNTQILVTYTDNISGGAPGVTAATSVADFFGNNAATKGRPPRERGPAPHECGPSRVRPGRRAPRPDPAPTCARPLPPAGRGVLYPRPAGAGVSADWATA